MELDLSSIVVGGRYRGRKPEKVSDLHRTVWDDRTVVWVGPGQKTLEYTSASTKGERTPVSMSNFLQWAIRQLGEEEGSDAKK